MTLLQEKYKQINNLSRNHENKVNTKSIKLIKGKIKTSNSSLAK